MSLREITKDLHHEAETTKFAKLLLSGKIEKSHYRNYLYNLLAVYDPIEWYAARQGMFDNLLIFHSSCAITSQVVCLIIVVVPVTTMMMKVWQ